MGHPGRNGLSSAIQMMIDRIPWLSLTLPDDQILTRELEKDIFLIGRDESADLGMATHSISRRHAAIRKLDGVWYLVDLGSRNGTFLNGQPVYAQPQRLRDGSAIVLGGEITLYFHDPRETAESAPIGSLKGVWINPKSKEVWMDARFVDPPLSASQYALLERLYRTPGEVVTRSEIITAIWPESDPQGVSNEAIDGLIKRLRVRLREAQPEREYIEVLRGHGLRLIVPKG